MFGYKTNKRSISIREDFSYFVILQQILTNNDTCLHYPSFTRLSVIPLFPRIYILLLGWYFDLILFKAIIPFPPI